MWLVLNIATEARPTRWGRGAHRAPLDPLNVRLNVRVNVWQTVRCWIVKYIRLMVRLKSRLTSNAPGATLGSLNAIRPGSVVAY